MKMKLLNYITDDGLTVLESEYIKTFIRKRPCDRCDRTLFEHEWVALNWQRVVQKCSFSDTKPEYAKNFSSYVSYNGYGTPEIRVDRTQLETWVIDYELNNIKAKGCWEFARDDNGYMIHARLAPECELDGRDTNWRSWRYTFVPYIP